MLSRKDLFQDTLRKAAHVWKRIAELKLTGRFPNILEIYYYFSVCHFFFVVECDSTMLLLLQKKRHPD